MSYTIESVNGCTKKFLFKFDSIDLSKEIQQTLAEKQKKSNLKGFRPGKAPMELVKKMFGPQAESEAMYKFFSSQFFDAVKKEGLRTIGYPNFTNTNLGEDRKNVSFEAQVEIFPEFEVKGVKEVKVTKENTDVTEDEIKKNQERYLLSKSELRELNDDSVELKSGLFAVINFQGELPTGEKPENMKGSEFLLEIGSGQFIPGFEDSLVGQKKGETRNIEVVFPKEYQEPTLREAKVKFEVTLLEIKERKIPELTDELAKEFGFLSVEDFHKKSMEALKFQKESQAKSKIQQEILNQLVEKNVIDLPELLVQEQMKALKQDILSNLKSQGLPDSRTEEYFEKWGGDLKAKAEFQVRSGLILDKLANQFNIEVAEKDLTDKYLEIAAQSGMPVEEVEKYYSSQEKQRDNLRYVLREEKTFDKILASIK